MSGSFGGSSGGKPGGSFDERDLMGALVRELWWKFWWEL